jgi:hypothetical protein
MPRKPSGRPVGRPEKPIDWSQFEQLCALQCTQSEIGSMLKLCKEALTKRVREHYGEEYMTVYKRFCENGKCSLRRNQFVLSKKNASLAIWLGKIWLGQKDPGIDETKEDALNAIRQAIKEISAEPRTDASQRPPVEIKQLILDKELGGETTEIPT